MIKVNAVALNHTRYYNIREEDKRHIEEIHSVYCYNPNSCTHLCELTPSYELRYLYTYIVFSDELEKVKLSDDLRDLLTERYCYCDSEDIYMHCADVKSLPTVKECGEFEDIGEAHEYLQGNYPI